MDIEKLRKDLLENSDPDGPCIEDDLMQAAATALSTLQGENESLKEKLYDGEGVNLVDYWMQQAKIEENGHRNCQAENEKLREELERVTAERDAARSLLAERIGVIGAEPITTAFGLPLDRLRKLAQADREGRCVVLPCNVGDTLYRIQRFKRGKSWRKEAEFIRTVELNRNNFWRIVMDGEIGETVFLTRAEAEAALRREQDGNNK